MILKAEKHKSKKRIPKKGKKHANKREYNLNEKYKSYNKDYSHYDLSYGQLILQNYIYFLSTYTFKINYRPDWLYGLELDIFFSELNCGIEFNGAQHYKEYIGYGNLTTQIRNDKRKIELCKSNNVGLISLTACDLDPVIIVKLLNQLNSNIVNRRRTETNADVLLDLIDKSKRYINNHPKSVLGILKNAERVLVKSK